MANIVVNEGDQLTISGTTINADPLIKLFSFADPATVAERISYTCFYICDLQNFLMSADDIDCRDISTEESGLFFQRLLYQTFSDLQKQNKPM